MYKHRPVPLVIITSRHSERAKCDAESMTLAVVFALCSPRQDAGHALHLGIPSTLRSVVFLLKVERMTNREFNFLIQKGSVAKKRKKNARTSSAENAGHTNDSRFKIPYIKYPKDGVLTQHI